MILWYDMSLWIVEWVGCLAYCLHLPPCLLVQLVFHVSLLKAYHVDDYDPFRHRLHRAPLTMWTHFTEQAEDILAHRVVDGGDCNHAH